MYNKLLTYQQILEILEKTKPNNHLLLGNGFNVSLGVQTSYKSIFEVMKNENPDYNLIESDKLDLEHLIEKCKENIMPNGSQYSLFMEKFIHNKIKLDFMKAVTKISTKEVKKIYQKQNEEIYLLLKQFDNYFTLNYDPFLYQLLMLYKKTNEKDKGIVFRNSIPGIKTTLDKKSQQLLKEIENGYKKWLFVNIHKRDTKKDNSKIIKKAGFTAEIKKYYKDRASNNLINKIIKIIWMKIDEDKLKSIEKVDDGFRNLFGEDLIYDYPETQNLYFLHGAFHIYQKGKLVKKITQQSDKALYTRIEDIIDNADKNIICVFSDKNKEREINQNEYLRNGLKKLKSLKGTILIIGSSISDNDSHIFNKINESDISKIIIGTSQDEYEATNISAKKYFPQKSIILFDYKTITYT